MPKHWQLANGFISSDRGFATALNETRALKTLKENEDGY
jgi:hypothetical protein